VLETQDFLRLFEFLLFYEQKPVLKEQLIPGSEANDSRRNSELILELKTSQYSIKSSMKIATSKTANQNKVEKFSQYH
jgi:hypothetical protein